MQTESENPVTSDPKPILVPGHEAADRLERDRKLLLAEFGGRAEDALTAPYTVAGGPLGDFCESLHDLVAHVLMWDEINLAVLAEARQGRAHWSLDPRWESRDAGMRLNASGVAAGRELPTALLVHRFTTARDALVAEIQSYGADGWAQPLDPAPGGHEHSIGSLAQYVMTVPGAIPFWHAAIHLNQLPEVATP